ncbi:EcsC family protein [Stigmatella hybrida]|uniref:EcsC family protein n=1 Tax=Stigmatella hybrida TaxID=394097 RepID=UPI001CDAB173|nr:EcsC family protein [Stigmatella hybrida]
MSMKDDVRQEYEDLKFHFRGTSFEDFKSGGWFLSFVQWILKEHAQKVDAAYIRQKYPGAGPHNQAAKAISLASKYASLAGGVSAAAVTGMELALPTPGAPLAVGGIAALVMADIGLTTRLQLRTAYDLSVIHRAPLSLGDAEDCYLIFLNALGIKLSELGGNLLKAVGPKVIQYNVRRLLRSGVRAVLVELISKVAGTAIARKLTEKALMRVLVPGIGIPISAAANYAFTKSMLTVAERQMRRRGFLMEPLLRLYAADKEFPRLVVLQSLIVVMETPKRAGWDEDQMNALRYTQNFLSLADEQVFELDGWFDRKVEDFAPTLPKVDAKVAAALVDFLVRAAALGEAACDEFYLEAIRAIAAAMNLSGGVFDIPAARRTAA